MRDGGGLRDLLGVDEAGEHVEQHGHEQLTLLADDDQAVVLGRPPGPPEFGSHGSLEPGVPAPGDGVHRAPDPRFTGTRRLSNSAHPATFPTPRTVGPGVAEAATFRFPAGYQVALEMSRA
ncbi:hypothetical protein GCM10027271_51700 [Saccharopolyspora gloriosae]